MLRCHASLGMTMNMKSCHSGWLRKLFIHLWGQCSHSAGLKHNSQRMRRLFRYQTDVVSLSAKGDLSVKYGEWVLQTILGCISDFSTKAWELKEKWGRVRGWNSGMFMLLIELLNVEGHHGILRIPDTIVDLSRVLSSWTLSLMSVQICSFHKLRTAQLDRKKKLLI